MTEPYHFPPDVFNLLVDTVPRLCKSKADILTFFQGAGVPASVLRHVTKQVREDRNGISKAEIARDVLSRLNNQGDDCLTARREVIKRVVEFTDFSACWPNDQLQARGLVASVRELVNAKDTVTKIRIDRDRERDTRLADQRARTEELHQKKEQHEALKRDFFALFGMANHHKRGTDLESALNRLFALNGILVRDAFLIVGRNGEGIVEQIDGAVTIDGHIYLVEMKWLNEPVGPPEISQTIVRVMARGRQARGIFLSYSDYTAAAINTSREALGYGCVLVLCRLEEFVRLLERGGDLRAMLDAKIKAALLDKNPMHHSG